MEFNKKTRLAFELSETLNDKDALPLYLRLVEEYSEEVLRQVLMKVMAIPDNKVRKTRGAYFNYLIHQHGKTYHRD